ncbi:MAG: hypothetical protein WC682_05020 [Parcubacteria group bacterium]
MTVLIKKQCSQCKKKMDTIEEVVSCVYCGGALHTLLGVCSPIRKSSKKKKTRGNRHSSVREIEIRA